MSIEIKCKNRKKRETKVHGVGCGLSLRLIRKFETETKVGNRQRYLHRMHCIAHTIVCALHIWTICPIQCLPAHKQYVYLRSPVSAFRYRTMFHATRAFVHISLIVNHFRVYCSQSQRLQTNNNNNFCYHIL